MLIYIFYLTFIIEFQTDLSIKFNANNKMIKLKCPSTMNNYQTDQKKLMMSTWDELIKKAKQSIKQKYLNKYCSNRNQSSLSQINQALTKEKYSRLATIVKDIRFDIKQQKMDKFNNKKQHQLQIEQLIEYYKYYSQKSILFIKQFFPLLYQYHQRKKIIEYRKLKFILNLSDSNTHQDSQQSIKDQSLQDSQDQYFINNKQLKGFKGINILQDLNNTQKINTLQNNQSFLMNELRNNLSKHINTGKRCLSVEQIDRNYDFLMKDQAFRKIQKNKFFITQKTKQNKFFITQKTKQDKFFSTQKIKDKKLDQYQSIKFSCKHTRTNTLDNMYRKSIKRNNSCEDIQKLIPRFNPYQDFTTKIRRKKNMSMLNLKSSLSTPGQIQQKMQQKMKNPKLETRQTQKNKQSSRDIDNLFQNINGLKNKIKKSKEKLLKCSDSSNLILIKKLKKPNQNDQNQKISKKNTKKKIKLKQRYC